VTPAATFADTSDLDALVPTQVGDIAMDERQTAPIDLFLENNATFQAVLTAVGKSPSDLSIVQASGSNPAVGEVIIIQALRVAGADAAALMNGILEFFKVGTDVTSPVTIAGKQLIVQGHPDTDAQYKSYYYSYGDVVFRLGYNGPNFDARMAEIVSLLP
jgi:hypothetical protein